MKKRPPHWYRLYIGECPVCGRKPKKREDRVVYLSQQSCYDWCDV